MKDTEFNKRIDLVFVGGGFVAANEKAEDLIENCVNGEILSFIECTQRDINFHRCYMSLLNYIYEYMPKKFKESVPNKYFYEWLKHLRGHYDIVFEFNDGTKMIKYKSIAFGNMSQVRFKEYVKEQLPWIYENVIGKYFKGDIYDNIITTIENEYEKFMNRLN